MINMESTVAHAFHRFALAILGLALPVALVAYGGNGDSRKAAPLAPKAAALGRSMPETPTGDVLTISSPAFADGAPIPEQYTCKGANCASVSMARSRRTGTTLSKPAPVSDSTSSAA